MLRAVHSNRVERLLAALLDALPAADPFAPATIVVGSQLIARWLVREIALARGIAAGLELVAFDAFVEATWAGDAAGRAAGLGALDREQLAAALASVLADDAVVRDLAPVAAYLAAAPAPGDRAGPRRVQLADHLADLVWSYALSRPDWMPALVIGQVPGELAGDATARWQAQLIGAALSRLGGAGVPGRSADPRPGAVLRAPTPMLPWLRRRAGLATPVRSPVAVFGLSFLARAQLEALSDLSATTEVTVYVLDPCEELWDDVAGRRAAAAAPAPGGPAPSPPSDPLPLVLWGRPVRDTLGALVERTGGDLEGWFDGAGGATARDRLLDDVRTRRRPAPGELPPGAPAAGVTVLACPNSRREIEAIAAEARRRLDADPALRAHEIAVWIAGDAERYLAQAPSAFEAVGVPCHLIDAPIDDRGRIGEAVLALLELPTSAMTRRDLLRVMTHPAVLAGYPHVDADDWVRWTERLGIVHGRDAAAHAGTYLEDYPGLFHWDQGVRRLALGAFMVGERAARGAARIASLEVAPEELRPEQQASAATYALLVRSLCADAEWLAGLEAPLARWADVLASLVDDYLAPRDDDATRDLERVRALLAGIARVDLDGRLVGFREAREHAARRLAAARANRGEPLAAGVMIAPLAAMRGVPFRVAFVAGLDEGVFPAGERTSPLDLRREPRPGDVAPRDRDRAAFLDVLLGTRDALYLSYVATEEKSGQPLAPSSIVLELADALAPYLGAGSSRAALAAITVHQPLHRSIGGVPARPPSLPSVARERWAVAVRDALRGHLRAAGRPIPDADGLLALLAHPAQAELRAALGHGRPRAGRRAARRARGQPPAHGRQPARVPRVPDPGLGPGRARARRAARRRGGRAQRRAVPRSAAPSARCCCARCSPPSSANRAGRSSAATTPSSGSASCAASSRSGCSPRRPASSTCEVLERWRAGLGPIAADGATRIGFGRASSPGAELRPALSIELPGGRTVRLVGQTELLVRGKRHTSVITLVRKIEKRSHYHLRGAFDHLLLAAAGIAGDGGHVHRLIDDRGQVCEIEHAAWTAGDARGYLAGLIAELLDAPHGYLLPFEALARALQGGRPVSRFGDPTAGLGYGPIDRGDGLAPPADAARIARRRLLPLVERMRGDHGFEVGP